MQLDEKMTVVQVVTNATKTIDGISAYLMIALSALACVLVAMNTYFSSGWISADASSSLFDIAILSLLTTPIMYLGLAYFSASGKFSELVNAVIIVSANIYMASKYFN